MINKTTNNKTTKSFWTYDQLAERLLKGITDDIFVKSTRGILKCCEKLGMTSEEAFLKIDKIWSKKRQNNGN